MHENNFNSLEDFQEGQVLVIDKPLTWTSFDVVNKVRGTIRHTFNIKKIKVGHAGTLDPLATGVLVICTGRKTKTIDLLQAEQKTYTGTIRLGITTPSYDAETKIDSWGDPDIISNITSEMIAFAASKLTGELDQMPPQFSAKKVDGVTAYKAARLGKTVALKTKRVTVNSFDIISVETVTIQEGDFNVIDVKFEVVCSKGTYIRSIAHDLGKALGVGGTLTSLRRTRSGNFTSDKAWNLDELLNAVKKAGETGKNE
ncbi:MAG: tRNA pseudouridine(55) synthase TruB [Bacteroidetes bacterium]|nr:MAG: tRNA pseudouridine(55) synthase TruB [Bacteroidota bacterium]